MWLRGRSWLAGDERSLFLRKHLRVADKILSLAMERDQRLRAIELPSLAATVATVAALYV